MFTGLVEKTALLGSREIYGDTAKLTVVLADPFPDLKLGESIAVNGTCLTLEAFSESELVFHVLNETLNRTNLGVLSLNSRLNLERALAVGARLGGHFVSGHIDTTAKVLSWTHNTADIILTVELPESIAKFVIEKGSIAIDGVSLTVASLTDKTFNVHLIPTTLNDTALQEREAGMLVNLEADMLAKFVERQVAANLAQSGKKEISMTDLINAGW
jgi:riboflavin synthase